jgi:VanZ family protein
MQQTQLAGKDGLDVDGPSNGGVGRWLLVLVYLTALVVGTHWPYAAGPPKEDRVFAYDEKIVHFLAYFGLAVLVFGLLANPSGAKAALWLAGLALLGGIDELTQPPFGRECDPYDWVADLAGLLLGWLAVVAWRRRG